MTTTPQPERSLDELQALSETQLRIIAHQLEATNPPPESPAGKLFETVLELADAAWLRSFNGRSKELHTSSRQLQDQIDAARVDLEHLNQGTAVLKALGTLARLLDEAATVAGHLAPLLNHRPDNQPTTPTPAPKRIRYGWIRDLPDSRDFLYAQLRGPTSPLPRFVDLRPQCSPVEDQGELGSCTANALVGALEFLEPMSKRKPATDLSRLFLYYNERALEGTVNEDSGAALRDGIKTLRIHGICPETLWPYDIRRFRERPPTLCYEQALNHQLLTYHSIRSIDEARACLADHYPFVFGFAVFDAFESLQVSKTGQLDYPGPTESQRGGHAVLAVGYDDARERFIIRNSWGPNWGQSGYFTMPYAYAFGAPGKPPLAADFWTLRKTE